jgi:hypothetical protein
MTILFTHELKNEVAVLIQGLSKKTFQFYLYIIM